MWRKYIEVNLDGKRIGVYAIALGRLNEPVPLKDYYEEARRCSIEDGLVSADDASKLDFKEVLSA